MSVCGTDNYSGSSPFYVDREGQVLTLILLTLMRTNILNTSWLSSCFTSTFIRYKFLFKSLTFECWIS